MASRGIKNLLWFILVMTGSLCVVSVRHFVLDYGLTSVSFSGDDAAVRQRLDAGANVNNTVLQGLSPVRAAVSHGHYRTTKLLLSRGADPNAALKQALSRQNAPIVTLCLDYGANAFATNAEHAAPFDNATPEMKKVIRDYYAQKTSVSK